MNEQILNIGCGDEDYGTERLDIIETSTTTKVYDVEKGIPYPDKSFDKIYSRGTLEHIKNIGIFADECYRVLKDGGEIEIITDYAGYFPMYISKNHEHNKMLEIHYKANNKQQIDRHYHLFVASHLKYLFDKFSEQEIEYIYRGGRNAFMRLFLRLLPFHLGALAIKIKCKRLSK